MKKVTKTTAHRSGYPTKPSGRPRRKAAAASEQVFICPAELTIRTVERVAQEINDASQPGGIFVVDISGLESITTPGIQLLLSLEASLLARNGELRLAHARNGHAHPFKTSGLDEKWRQWSRAISPSDTEKADL